VDEAVAAQRLESLIKQGGGEYLEECKLFDIYAGKQVPEGKKSVTFALHFRAPDRTLRENEVDEIQANILSKLQREVAAVLRS